MRSTENNPLNINFLDIPFKNPVIMASGTFGFGKEYAENGVKFSTFNREFDLYIDLISGIKENIKNIFTDLKSEKQYFKLVAVNCKNGRSSFENISSN